MTLWKRLLACIKKLLLALAESLGTDPIMILQELVNNKKYGKQNLVITSVLKEFYSQNQRDKVYNFY